MRMLEISRTSGEPIKLQIYRQLKTQMISGELREGEEIPSTRQLASALCVSRSTVVEAFDMLLSEGFLMSRQGAATVVAAGLVIQLAPNVRNREPVPKQYILRADFQTGRPDLNQFPRGIWRKLLYQAAGEVTPAQYGYTGPQGYLPLREEISAWLSRSRGFIVDAKDVFITAGATQALRILTDLLCQKGGSILIEDPCHMGLYKTLQTCGCDVIPVPVDEHGLQTANLPDDPKARAVYVTPSHQFPLGGILPAARRAALIRYAQARGLYVIEDDYDSEFRYSGAPIAPLCALGTQQVVYVGTFSKTMFPALRIGFAVLPKALQQGWREIRTHLDVQNPLFEQAALTEFLKTRKFDRHVRIMKNRYAKRRQALLDALGGLFGNKCFVCGDAAGLHASVRFFGRIFDEAFRLRCAEAGVHVVSLEQHSIVKGSHRNELVLGYGHLEPEEIRNAVLLLAEVMGKGELASYDASHSAFWNGEI